MRNIRKGSAPECLAVIEPSMSWSEFQGECKNLIGTQALDEQNGLCIYCERQIDSPNWSDTAHIEHMKPQGDSRYPNLRYCYHNMVFSCNGKPSDPTARGSYYGQDFSSCGPYKGSLYDPQLFIDPVSTEDLSEMITWDSHTAEMTPHAGFETRVGYMISILNINNHYLNNARLKAWGSFRKVYTDEERSVSERRSLLNSVREGKTEFCTFLNAQFRSFAG